MSIRGYNNNHDSVYGAVIVTKVIVRVYPVHLMNADWPPTLSPSQLTRTMSPPKNGIQRGQHL